jgi:hypothetical protein
MNTRELKVVGAQEAKDLVHSEFDHLLANCWRTFLPLPHLDTPMNLSTPPQGRSRHLSSSTRTPSTPTNTGARQFGPDTRRALGGPPGSGAGLRDRGTPVGRLLASEGMPIRSPRKVRQRSWVEK